MQPKACSGTPQRNKAPAGRRHARTAGAAGPGARESGKQICVQESLSVHYEDIYFRRMRKHNEIIGGIIGNFQRKSVFY